ncbi:Uncharacterised protein [Providencia rustigianii]|uniref:hypothetical protein n=1 Tax=Providencia rettgeri TaxID=587 RepID=UPI000F6C2911|nr:hypothetical protein [Providencia rettgeri]VEB72330.1 Uncharacterised protein [Providencia rustigianii]ELR5233322.1 hypothetical protein [Providencia rettgeri]ELR5287157.1 hypothetical protein [Providencia rettgeri]MDT5427538.1 hypothetical protein [Providencia rettgeri]NHN53861.1 hypothetical protein [Providencia rettgeri]
MKSKRIFYKQTGRDNEDYIFLDLNNGQYTVRIGSSHETGFNEWGTSDETTMPMDEFLASNPQYQDRINTLIAEFESEDH